MARAKRTDRTEARRRYRADQAALGFGPADDDVPAEAAPARDRSSAPAPASARPSIVASFRGAYRPLDLRGDLRALPQVVRHWSVLAAVAASFVSAALFIVSTNDLGASLDFSLSDPLNGKNIGSVSNISYLVVGLFVTPPPAAGAFLIGFFARRASWLGGLLFGIAAAFAYIAILVSPAGRLLTRDTGAEAYITQGLVLGPIGAALFASAAAWYRRFLDLANPNRGKRRPVRGQPARGTAKQKTRPLTSRSTDRRR